jgi:hypothetical protein
VKKSAVRHLLALAILFAGGGALLGHAQDHDPDNTRMNQRDRSSSEVTADQQKENRSDRDLARQIRRSITQDKSLSTYAHNVKIIAQNGSVTLKGPVRSAEEKRAVEEKAVEVAGEGHVKNEIQVAEKHDRSKSSADKY